MLDYNLIRYNQEQAQIEAWETLQRARAEAKLKRLEVKWTNVEIEKMRRLMNRILR